MTTTENRTPKSHWCQGAVDCDEFDCEWREDGRWLCRLHHLKARGYSSIQVKAVRVARDAAEVYRLRPSLTSDDFEDVLKAQGAGPMTAHHIRRWLSTDMVGRELPARSNRQMVNRLTEVVELISYEPPESRPETP